MKDKDAKIVGKSAKTATESNVYRVDRFVFIYLIFKFSGDKIKSGKPSSIGPKFGRPCTCSFTL